MPYKSEKKNVAGTQYDSRVKLTGEDKDRIRWLYYNTETSQRKLAKQFGVSRRLIQFITDPEKEKKCKEQFAERQKDGRYYDREEHNKQIKRLRAKKQKLHLEGKI